MACLIQTMKFTTELNIMNKDKSHTLRDLNVARYFGLGMFSLSIYLICFNLLSKNFLLFYDLEMNDAILLFPIIGAISFFTIGKPMTISNKKFLHTRRSTFCLGVMMYFFVMIADACLSVLLGLKDSPSSLFGILGVFYILFGVFMVTTGQPAIKNSSINEDIP